MSINWNLGLSQDVGATFMNAFEAGKQRRQQDEQRNALAAYAQNPNENSLNALAQFDPRFVVEQKRAQQTSEQEAIAKRVNLVGQAAQFADTPEKWDAAVEYLSQQYPDLGQYRGKFTPELRMSAIASAGQMKDYYEQNGSFTLAPGSKRFDAGGQLIAEAPFAPRPVTVGEGQTVVEYAPGGGFKGGFDQFYSGFLAPAEGGFNPKDPMSGAPVNFGIDQRANPDIDVKNLTQEQAKQLMLERYWKPSGADRIADPALQAIHADTAVNMGVNAAQGLLQKSGGDPERYLQLREQRYRQIGGPVLNGWLKRNEDLRQFAGVGGARVLATGAPKQEKPPAGYRWKPDGSLEPIPGGPVATKAAAGESKQEAYSQSAIDAFNRAISSANRLKEHPGFNAGVGVPSINPLDGNLAGYIIPGSRAADFRAELDAMKAQVFLPMVQSMKGMGALSNAEGDKLTASIGALDTKMSEGAFKASLERIISDLTSYRDRGARQGQDAGPARPSPNRQPARPTVTNW